MNYVCSDLHGCYDEYIELLDLINFSDKDSLFVIGDVLDRGENSIKILQDMMVRSNVFPIMGNHEFMALSCLKILLKDIDKDIKDINEEAIQKLSSWGKNGGENTITELFKLDQEEKEDILEYLGEFSTFEELTVQGTDYILVHTMGKANHEIDEDVEEYSIDEILWERCDYDKLYFSDKILITGHTPTRLIHEKDEVYKKYNHIAIDCGCVYGGKLAAYCLETDEVFYVNKN